MTNRNIGSKSKEGERFDVIVIGAGAAGMMCAAQAGQRGRRVLVLDHAAKAGEKIRISGGGRCNFTNLDCAPDRFFSKNPHFCKSALGRYTARDFLALVEAHHIAWHEKKSGQLFCDGKAQQIIDMLLAEMRRGKVQVQLRLQTQVRQISRTEEGFALQIGPVVTGRRKRGPGGDAARRREQPLTQAASQTLTCASLVVATGGKSIPKMGATGFGYEVARQFALGITPLRPALVPLTFSDGQKEELASLSGVSVEARICTGKTGFTESLLFTHRGLSGPAVLQVSSCWREGEPVQIRFRPDINVREILLQARKTHPRQGPHKLLAACFPKRLVASRLQGIAGLGKSPKAATGMRNMADLSNKTIDEIAAAFQGWSIVPTGTEGYRTAEVTLGGVDTAGLDSKTLEARHVKGLYFIGEVVDVTGWLGGYNFQWAWSSAHAAGQVV